MSKARRVCSEPACPVLVTEGGRCAEHRRQADRARGTRQQRGYDRTHERARRRALLRANAASPCARCGQPLGPNYRTAHLDHTDDRSGYLGLSHAACNTAAGGVAAHGA